MKQLLLAFSVAVFAFGTAGVLADDTSDAKLISEIDMNHLDKVAQDNDMTATTQSETAQMRAEHDAANAKWAAMTPAQKAAVRKAAQQKRLADMNAIERAGQEDSMGRYMGN